MAQGSCKDQLASGSEGPLQWPLLGGNTLHSLRHLPWGAGSLGGQEGDRGDGVCPRGRPHHCLSCNTSDGCAREKRGNRVGRADSFHQDATLEFLSTLTLPHPHPPTPEPGLWGSSREGGGGSRCFVHPEPQVRSRMRPWGTAQWLMLDSQH